MTISKIEYGMFALTEIEMKGKKEIWKRFLDLHDTYGLPFDLIYLKASEATNLIPPKWKSENFAEFMNLFRQTV